MKIELTSDMFFHFTNDKTLRDGSPIPPIGEWLIYPGKPIICKQGFHASHHPMDALKYAPGYKLHLVELSGIQTEEKDRVVAKGRKIVATLDSKEILRACARKYASDVLHLWKAPDIVKKYLRTGDESIRIEARCAAAAATYSANAAHAATATAATYAAYAAADAAADAAYAKHEKIKNIQREYFLSQIMEGFNK